MIRTISSLERNRIQGCRPRNCIPNSVNRLDLNLVRLAAQKKCLGFRKWRQARCLLEDQVVRPQGDYNEVKLLEHMLHRNRKKSYSCF